MKRYNFNFNTCVKPLNKKRSFKFTQDTKNLTLKYGCPDCAKFQKHTILPWEFSYWQTLSDEQGCFDSHACTIHKECIAQQHLHHQPFESKERAIQQEEFISEIDENELTDDKSRWQYNNDNLQCPDPTVFYNEPLAEYFRVLTTPKQDKIIQELLKPMRTRTSHA